MDVISLPDGRHVRRVPAASCRLIKAGISAKNRGRLKSFQTASVVMCLLLLQTVLLFAYGIHHVRTKQRVHVRLIEYVFFVAEIAIH